MSLNVNFEGFHFKSPREFWHIWGAEFLVALGNGITIFAISIWAWRETGSATTLALASFFAFLPSILLGAFAGTLVDYYDRKSILLVCSLGELLGSGVLFWLFHTGVITINCVYAINFCVGCFSAMHYPAYQTAISAILPKSEYMRAGGLTSFIETSSRVFSPVLAGALLGLASVNWVLALDFLFCLASLALLASVKLPQSTGHAVASKGSFFKDSALGMRFIFEHKSFRQLLMLFFYFNLIVVFSFTLFTPMLMARTNNNEVLVASIRSMGAIGGIIGSALATIWGGFRKKTDTILAGMAGMGVFIALAGFSHGYASLMLASLGVSLAIPFINASTQALWQAKVAHRVQGRVFAARRMISQMAVPISMLVAGPLADQVFEPLGRSGGTAVQLLTGTGKGAGMALLFVIIGVMAVVISVLGYSSKAIRNAEELLPNV